MAIPSHPISPVLTQPNCGHNPQRGGRVVFFSIYPPAVRAGEIFIRLPWLGQCGRAAAGCACCTATESIWLGDACNRKRRRRRRRRRRRICLFVAFCGLIYIQHTAGANAQPLFFFAGAARYNPRWLSRRTFVLTLTQGCTQQLEAKQRAGPRPPLPPPRCVPGLWVLPFCGTPVGLGCLYTYLACGKPAPKSTETRCPLSRSLWCPGRRHCFTSFGESVCCSWQQKGRLHRVDRAKIN
jgi:hypothetical protein